MFPPFAVITQVTRCNLRKGFVWRTLFQEIQTVMVGEAWRQKHEVAGHTAFLVQNR